MDIFTCMFVLFLSVYICLSVCLSVCLLVVYAWTNKRDHFGNQQVLYAEVWRTFPDESWREELYTA